MGNQGRAKHPAGLRLYNQKYYPVNFDAEDQHLYLKKVFPSLYRNTEEHVWPSPKTTTSSEASTFSKKWTTASLKTQES